MEIWQTVRHRQWGKPRFFDTPQELWEKACEYFKFVDKNHWNEIKALVVSDGAREGSSIKKVKLPIKLPYSIQELQIYLGVSHSYFDTYLSKNRDNQEDERIKAFIDVIREIKAVIASQQFKGASAGVFKENIISRMLNLSDKVETINLNSVPMTKEEMKKLNDELENEV
jgi:hypothetical protein